MFLEAREIKLFGRDIPGFCWDIPAAPEKFEKKKFGVQFLDPIIPFNLVLKSFLLSSFLQWLKHH